MGREGTRIHILQRKEVNLREVKQCAQGHTAFQSERTKPGDCLWKPPALDIAESQTGMAALPSPSETHCKRSNEWNSAPGHTWFALLINIWSAPQLLLWSYVYQARDLFFLPSAECFQKPEAGEVTWVHCPLIVWNDILFTRYTSLLLMCSSLISSHLRPGSLGEKKIN